MIQVTVFVDPATDHITGFHTYGHDGYADEEYDIICSAVSAIVLTTVNSIDELTKDIFQVSQDQEQGEILFRFGPEARAEDRIGMVPSSAEAELLLRSMMIGLKGIAEEYGSQYLRVSTKEV